MSREDGGIPVPLRPPPAIRLVAPPLCWGEDRSSRLDVMLLRSRLRGPDPTGAPRCALLSDIPDDLGSLAEGLALPGLLGALALGCGSLDLWLAPAVEAAVLRGLAETPAVAPAVRRSGETPLARLELREPAEAQRLWELLSALAAPAVPAARPPPASLPP